MKAKYVKIINLIVALLVALFCVGQVFAWLSDGKIARDKLFGGSSAGAYFAYGAGTEDDPFGINKRFHLYNLAWLQNTGSLEGTQYYFELDPEMDDLVLDDEDFWLPPIGNDEYPFEGIFNGNGKAIANLKITTDKNKLFMIPVGSAYAFSNAVGFFGMTAEDSAITNLILENPRVEAVEVNGKDSSGKAVDTKYSGTEHKAIGLAVGYVGGLCQSIGVYAHESGAQDTFLDVQRAQYSTFNSILGELGPNVESSVTGGGNSSMGSGGSGSNFGATFDVDSMVDRLFSIYRAKYGAEYKKGNNLSPIEGSSFKLPLIDDSSNYPVPEKGEEVPFAIDTGKTSYEGPDAEEIASDNNVGYFFGNQNKIEITKEISFSQKLTNPGDGDKDWYDSSTGKTPAESGKVPAWFYKFNYGYGLGSDVYRSKHGFAPLTQAEFAALPQDIQDIIPTDLSVKNRYIKISLSQAYWIDDGAVATPGFELSDNVQSWSYHGSISWMGRDYGVGYRDDNGYATDENGHNYAKDDFSNNLNSYYKYLYNKVDENNYLFNDEGYVMGNGIWPFQYSGVDEEGYIIDNDGNRYQDSDGNYIKYGGYDIDGEGYLIKDGKRYTGKTEWSTVELKAKVVNVNNIVSYHGFEEGIVMPNSAIWFKPAQAGTVKIIMYSPGDLKGFALLKIVRKSATKRDPFKVSFEGESWNSKPDIEISNVERVRLPKNVFFYFDYEITQDEIDAGNVEYMLVGEYGGCDFIYLDLGASAADDNSGVVDRTVSAVDFIYEKIKIAQKADESRLDDGLKIGDFIVSSTSGTLVKYNPSKTSVYFDKIGNALSIVFVRINSTSTTISVDTASSEVTATNTSLVSGLI